MKRPRSPLPSVLVLLPILLAGCDGSSSSPTEPATIPSPLAGAWQGTTNQGQTLSFTVGGSAQAPAITSFDLTVELDELTPGPVGVICLAATIGISASPVSIPIVDNGFLVRIPEDLPITVSPLGASFRFEGAFASATASSGLLVGEAPASAFGCVGSGTTSWTAQKS